MFDTSDGSGDKFKGLRQKLVLFGENKPGSRFGTTITNIGDLDKDGYSDVAVGAPGGIVYLIILGYKKKPILFCIYYRLDSCECHFTPSQLFRDGQTDTQPVYILPSLQWEVKTQYSCKPVNLSPGGTGEIFPHTKILELLFIYVSF